MLIFPLFIPHIGCPQTCIYCDQYQISGIKRLDWNSIFPSIRNFCHLHPQEEKEIAFYGGSFTCLPQQAQKELYDRVAPFLDKKTYLRYSTRPDGISTDILQESFKRGVRTIELGIQDFSDHVLVKSQRGYDRKHALWACKLVKASGLKLSVQIMPGLPGYNSLSLAQTIEDTISVQPDYVRIYPTIVIAGTALETMYHNGEYTPLDFETALRDVCLMVDRFEMSGIKVIKIGLTGMEPTRITAGPYHPSFGEIVRAERYIQRIVLKHDPNLILTISKKDISLLLGHKKEYLTRIKHEFNKSTIKIKISDTVNKGEFLYSNAEEFVLW
jgi:histone acetyltransferase (RNA polymerase elongator complex component)